LTNGYGLLYAKMKLKRIAMIKSRQKKSRIISVLIALVLLVLPLILYMVEVVPEHEGIVIDGNFDDWGEIESYQDQDLPSPNSNLNIDILEYRMVKEEYGAAFYLKTSQPIFQGEPQGSEGYKTDTIHIFVDIDKSKGTGYMINNIGADVLLKIDGYNNEITSSHHYIFNPYGNVPNPGAITNINYNWNCWEQVGTLQAEAKDTELELRALIEGMDKNIDVSFNSLDGNGNQDFSDQIISNQKGTLIVYQSNIGNDVFPKGSINNEILKITLRAQDEDIEVNSISLNVEGTVNNGDISNIKLFLDVNNDYNFNLGVDELLEIAALPTGTKNVIYNFPENLIVSKDEIKVLFISIDVSPTAMSHNTIGVSISDVSVEKGTVTGIDYNDGSLKSYLDAWDENNIVVDGAFNDWESVSTVKTYSNPTDGFGNINVDMIEYKLNSASDHLSFYFKVAGNMLDGTKIPASAMYISTSPSNFQDSDNDGVPDHLDPNPFESPTPTDTDNDGVPDDYEIVIIGTDPFNSDTDYDGYHDNVDYFPLDPYLWAEPLLPWILGQDQAYLFIDSDQNPGTGYRVIDNGRTIVMGAEYVVIIKGKYGTVLTKKLYEYAGNGWNWNFISNVPVGKDLTRLETQVELSQLNINQSQDYNVYFYISDWQNRSVDRSDLIYYFGNTNFTTRANNPYFSEHVHPNDVENSDSDILDYTNLIEDANGDGVYEQSGDASEPNADWIEVYFPSANLISGSVINNITYYYGYYTNDGWSLTTDSTSNITWRVNATENNLGDYTLSSPPDTDIDTTLIQTTNLPTATNLSSGNFKVRFRGIEDGGGPDRFYLDYCYFIVNYSIPEIVINEIMFDPTGDDNNSEWVELYNAGNSAVDLTGWNLTDNDGNRFSLSGAGSIPSGGYLICHLAQTGTNSSTNVYGSIETEFVLQPNASVGNDTYISDFTPTINYGLGDALVLETTLELRRMLIQFNLSGVPNGNIIDADVWLYRYGGHINIGAITNVSRITQNWTETDATWNTYDGSNSWTNAGGDYNTTVESTTTVVAGVNSWYSWDITNLTKAWKNGTYQNYGMIFIAQALAGLQNFYSSDYTTDPSLRPKLVLEIKDLNKSMLDDNDDLTLLDNNDEIIDYIAWGANAGTDDDDANASGQWTDGDFVNTTLFNQGQTLGRDKDSTDTDTVSDWENASDQADPYGVHSGSQTPGAQNIPEFETIAVPVSVIFIGLILIKKRRKRVKTL
jgi:hypothetical protein